MAAPPDRGSSHPSLDSSRFVPGTVLDKRYRIVGLLGRGGMGEVYRADDLKLGQPVALKFLPEGLERDEQRLNRFLNEVRTARQVTHPNVCRVFDIGEVPSTGSGQGGQHYISMEYVDGEDLSSLLRRIGHLPKDKATQIARQLCAGVQAAHEQGILHRDLKPANVMIDGRGQVKITDFGLADLEETIQQSEIRSGTPAYMAPEQFAGKEVTVKSDIYALGLVLYELFTGQRAFEAKTATELARLHQDSAPTKPSSHVEGFDPAIERSILGCLEKQPGDRPATALAVSEALPGGAPLASRSRVGWFIAIAGTIVVAAVLVAWFGWWGAPGRAPASSEEPSVAVIGFENLGDPEDSDNLGRMLMGLISTDLAESGGLSVVSTPRVLSARREVEGTGAFDMASAEQTARAAGAAVMIVGQIARAGDRFVLTAEWIDVPSGQSIGSHRQDAETMDGFFALADSVADAAREALGVVPVVSGIDLDRALTTSADAYKHYVLGEAAEREGGDWEKATREYERAISVDPTFALAYLRAGIALIWAQRAERGMEIMEDGMPYIDRLPERWQVVYRATMDFGALRTEAAYEALSALVKQQVDVPIAYYMLGEIMTHSDRHEDIREARRHFQRALDLDPSFTVSLLDHLVRGYIAADDLEDAQRLVARLVEADDPVAYDTQNLILWGEGRLEEAIAQGEAILSARGQHGFYVYLLPHLLNAVGDFERAAEIAMSPDAPPGIGDRRMSSARALIGLGRVDEALGEYSRGAAEQRGTFSRGVAANMEVSRSLLFLFQGEVATAGEAARRALEIEPFFHGARYVLGVVQIRSGDETAARRTLSELREAIGQSVGAGGRFWEHLLATEIAIAEGNPTAARASFERIRGMPPEYRPRREERVVLARLNEAEGDLPAAVDAMRDALDPRHDFWGSWYSFSFLSIIQYELAQLEERAGQSAAAVASYRRFLDRWGKAEDAFPAVAHARERIAALEED